MTEPEFIATMNKNAAECATVAVEQRRMARPLIFMCIACAANVGAVCYFSAKWPPAMYFAGGICVGFLLALAVAIYMVAKHRQKSLMQNRQQILNHKALVVSTGCLRRQEEDEE